MTAVGVPGLVRTGTFGWCLVGSRTATMTTATGPIRTEAA